MTSDHTTDNEAIYSTWNNLQRSLKIIGDNTIQ